MANTISFSDYFINFLKTEYPTLPSAEQKIISQFIADYIKYGFVAPPLCGKKKSSADTPNDQDRDFALEYGLHHYHIGIPEYNTQASLGNWTSEKVMNYCNKKCKASIKLISLESHPPFIIPNLLQIKGETIHKS